MVSNPKCNQKEKIILSSKCNSTTPCCKEAYSYHIGDIENHAEINRSESEYQLSSEFLDRQNDKENEKKSFLVVSNYWKIKFLSRKYRNNRRKWKKNEKNSYNSIKWVNIEFEHIVKKFC